MNTEEIINYRKNILGRIDVFCSNLELLSTTLMMQTAKDDVIEEYNSVYDEAFCVFWKTLDRSLDLDRSDLVNVRNADILHRLYVLRRDLNTDKVPCAEKEPFPYKASEVSVRDYGEKFGLSLEKIEKCSYLLPHPGGEVVRELISEFRELHNNLDYQASLRNKVQELLQEKDKAKRCGEISASEALFGFMGWLTSRDEAVTFSGHHSAAKAADLVALFCGVNNLAEPREHEHWDKNIVHPKECRPDGEPIVMGEVTEEDRSPSPWRPYLEQILSKLSGDLNHDNIAAAKEILKGLLN